MRLLLDTHALLWWLDGDKRLSLRIRRLILGSPTDILVSAATVWEITTKARLGKLPRALDVAADVPECIRDQGFTGLPLALVHAQVAGTLPGIHRDPWDRMLIAQSQLERTPIISADEIFDHYGVNRVW